VHEHDVISADGTRIRMWRAGEARAGREMAGRDTGSRDVLLCPGLGTMPEAWPYLARPGGEQSLRVHGWYHRGTLGSARPADPTRVRLADHVSDAIAVLDDAGITRTVVMGWSVGAAVAVEMAHRHPERVSGLLLVTGGPGNGFGGMFGGIFGRLDALGVPTVVRRGLARGAAKLVGDAGPVLNAVLHRVPVNRMTAAVARHSGVLRPASRTADVVAAGRRFLSHDWRWYGELAVALADEPAPDLAGVCCPVTVLTGRYDVLADARHVAKAVGALPQARIRMLPTSHFLPLEAPAELAAELRQLIERVDAVEGAVRWARQAPATYAARWGTPPCDSALAPGESRVPARELSVRGSSARRSSTAPGSTAHGQLVAHEPGAREMAATRAAAATHEPAAPETAATRGAAATQEPTAPETAAADESTARESSAPDAESPVPAPRQASSGVPAS
jgi:pimeloyl-ACP methyl ester carboxylesterase